MKKALSLILVLATSVSMLTGCGSTEGEKPAVIPSTEEGQAQQEETGLSGEITFAINRSEEEIETMYQPIADRFMEENPGTKVEIAVAEKDANIARTQLNAGEFPDISIVPRDIPASELSRFYMPIGKTDELSQKYQYAGLLAYEGDTYALPNGVMHSGIIYNKQVIDTYLDGKVPATLDEWYEAAATLKENGIVPLWTNAGAKWPMAEWDRVAISISGDAGYRNSLMETEEPWAEGTPLRELATIIETFTKNDWVEEDVVLEQWDNSRTMMVNGEIGFMVLGSWAVPQLKDVATTLGQNPDDIGFAPIPCKNDVSAENPLYVTVVEDMMFAVNKDTESPELSVAFLEYFLASEAPRLMGLSSPVVGGEKAEWVKDFANLDYVVELQEELPNPGVTEFCNKIQLDVFVGGTYMITNIIEPLKNGKEPTIDALNELWSENINK